MCKMIHFLYYEGTGAIARSVKQLYNDSPVISFSSRNK